MKRPQRSGSRSQSSSAKSSPPAARQREKRLTDEEIAIREELAYFDKHVAQLAVPFDEDKTRFHQLLVLEARSYKVPLLFDVTPDPSNPEDVPRQNLLYSPNREFAYMNRLWERGWGIPLLQGRREGVVYWNDDVVIPVLLDGRTLAVWMSLTPMEVLSQREAISMAKGTVVIGGLGLGWLLKKVCEKTTVQRVIVIEQSQELLDWYGHRLCSQYPKVTDVICDDIYNHLGKWGEETRYLLDIWPGYGDAYDDGRFQLAKHSVPHLWGWGDYLLGRKKPEKPT